MKKIFSTVTIVLIVLFVTACGGDRTIVQAPRLVEWYDLAADANLDPNQEITITFWHRMGASSQALIQTWISEFKVMYPNITVIEEKAAGDYTALSEKIALAIPGGNAPDIAESYPDHIARYAAAKAPLALNNFINNPNIGLSQAEVNDFLQGLWAEGRSYDSEGTILSLPFSKSSEAFFYNETYFNAHSIDGKTYTQMVKEGLTWDKVFLIAEDIKNRETALNPLVPQLPFGYDSEDNLFITGSKQWDAPYTGYNATTGKGEVQFNNDASKDMVRYFKDKVDRGLMITRSLNGDAFTSDLMKTGKTTYMYVGSTGGTRYAYIGGQTAFNAGYRVGVAPVPVKSLDNPRQIQQGPNINLFKSNDEQRMIAAWLFAKYMVSPEKTAEFSIPSGYAPIRSSSYELPIWKNYVNSIVANPTTLLEAQNKLVKEAIDIFLENENIFFTSAVFNLSSKTRTEAGALLFKILAYKADNQAQLDAYIDEQYQDSFDSIVN
jgi:multiple sugar transport system substrate-binding protein